ncbi:MAG: transcriptional regulator, partial [Lachnospiraceae bacterium]|nr:transcriptional regulator [Lachnospiraceae bacterium]
MEEKIEIEVQKQELKDMRESVSFNRREFAESFGIPLRTVEDWEAGRRKMPEYLLRLMGYKLRMEAYWREEEKRRQREKSRNVSVIQEPDGKKVVLINDIRFKGKNREEWNEIEEYLKEYVGEYYEIEENSDIVYIDSDFPDEFANSESRLALKGPVAKAKANASQGIPELIQIATNESFQENTKKKHATDAKYGWYRYDVRFALPVYDDKTGKLARYNIY